MVLLLSKELLMNWDSKMPYTLEVEMRKSSLKVTMPKPQPLAGAQMAAFKATIAPSIAKMDSMERGLQLAKR